MTDADQKDLMLVRVGGLRRDELVVALEDRRVRTNESAEILLRGEMFDHPVAELCHVVFRTVRQLGFDKGANLSSILARAPEVGLLLCPVITGPYLRLAMTDQRSAPDSILSTGTAPTGSITVASAPLDVDDVAPKGFYLRVIDDVPWLRGYRATDQHLWSPDDCLAFRRENSTREHEE